VAKQEWVEQVVPKEHYLVITASGTDKSGILADISKLCSQNKCNILDSKVTIAGEHCALFFWIAGPWHGIAKLEGLLPARYNQTDLELQIKRTQNPLPSSSHLPYSVQLTSIDRPGIIKDISQFFAQRRINIEDLSTSLYIAAKTNIQMCTLECLVRIPKKVSIASLRDEFLDYCDEFNLDATLDAHN